MQIIKAKNGYLVNLDEDGESLPEVICHEELKTCLVFNSVNALTRWIKTNAAVEKLKVTK